MDIDPPINFLLLILYLLLRILLYGAPSMAQQVKNLPAMQEMQKMHSIVMEYLSMYSG